MSQKTLQTLNDVLEDLSTQKFDPTVPAFQLLDRRRGNFEFLYFKQQMSLRDIAARMGMAPSTLQKWTKERGIKLRDMPTALRVRYLQEDKDAEAVRLRLQENLGLEEIAHRMGYQGKAVVWHVLDRNGIRGKMSALPSWGEYVEQRKQREPAEDSDDGGAGGGNSGGESHE